MKTYHDSASSPTTWFHLFTVFAGLMLTLLGNIALAQSTQSFRIDTDIYDDRTAKPTATIKTLFHDGKYIEVDDATHQALIFEPAANKIIVIDPARNIRTQLDMRSIESRLTIAEAKMDPRKRIEFSSQIPPRLDNQGFLVLSNAHIQYRYKPQSPANREIANSYADYADWRVRYNALYPPNFRQPPQLRMQVNQLLIDEGLMPQEIRRSILGGKESPNEIVAVLLIKESLGEEDRQLLQRIESWLHKSNLVDDEEFYKVSGN